MKGFFLLATLTLVSVQATPDVSHLLPPGSGGSIYRTNSQCKQCKPATYCKSEVIVNEIDVPKDVSIPGVEAREKIVYKPVPVPEYEIRNKVNTKLVRVPAEKVTFTKSYRDGRVQKQKVRKPLIKYDVKWLDVEVERLVVHEKPVPIDVPVNKVKRVPVVTDNHEPIFVEKKRPVGRPVPEPKKAKVPSGIRKEQKRVRKEVKVPEIAYHYCDTEKKIYVPDKCDADVSAGGAGSVRSEEFSRRLPPPDIPVSLPAEPVSYGYNTQEDRDFPQDLRDSNQNRFVRHPDGSDLNVGESKIVAAKSFEPVKSGREETNLFSARRFARAVSSFLSS